MTYLSARQFSPRQLQPVFRHLAAGFHTRTAFGNGEAPRILAASAHIPQAQRTSPQPLGVGPPLHPWLPRPQRAVPPWPAGPAQLPHAAAQPCPVHAQPYPFMLSALTTALGMPPISLCRCSSDFRSSAVHLSVSAVGLLQFVFDCVRPARLSPRRSSLLLIYSCHRG
jgi:hypothetical protein